MSACRRALFFSLAVLLAASAQAADKPRDLKPTRQWTGVHKDEKVKKMAPEAGFVTDAKAFAKLWKAWRPEEKVPEVNFKKEIVIVATSGGPTPPNVSATRDDKGAIRNPGGGQAAAQKELEAAMAREMPSYQAVQKVELGAGVVLAGMMIASGIGLLNLQPWARVLALVYAVLSLIVRAGDLGYAV